MCLDVLSCFFDVRDHSWWFWGKLKIFIFGPFWGRFLILKIVNSSREFELFSFSFLFKMSYKFTLLRKMLLCLFTIQNIFHFVKMALSRINSGQKADFNGRTNRPSNTNDQTSDPTRTNTDLQLFQLIFLYH